MSDGSGIGTLLCETSFRNMYAEFMTWRIDPFIREQERQKSKGRILPFIRGLRLSAHLIYAIREIVKGTGLTASWGHLLDDKREFCSCECDVIVHHEGHVGRWNGSKEPIMDFSFIDRKNALLVISCKSYLKANAIDGEYCKQMSQFIDKIWLFAECCGPRSVYTIEKRAPKIGYEKFWALYTWSKTRAPEPNRAHWNEFVREIEKLKV